jgi:hypothetical protein
MYVCTRWVNNIERRIGKKWNNEPANLKTAKYS